MADGPLLTVAGWSCSGRSCSSSRAGSSSGASLRTCRSRARSASRSSTSVYLSAHLVDVVARVTGLRPAAVIGLRAPARGRDGRRRPGASHRWLAPFDRPTLAGIRSTLRDDAAAWLIAAAVGSLVAIVLFGNGWRETPDGWVSGGWDWSDLLVHVAIGSSILHGNFPPEVPYFAGEPLTYHWFADFHGAIAATAAGLDLIPVYFATSALFAGVLALVVWALALRLTGDRRVALIATILVCIGGGMGWIRLVLRCRRRRRATSVALDHPAPVRQQLGGRVAVLPDRVGARHRLLPPPRVDARTPGTRVGRAARRVSASTAGRPASCWPGSWRRSSRRSTSMRSRRRT